jgi:uncharacterized protein
MVQVPDASDSRRGPWVMRMRWSELLFMHWPVPAAALRTRIPSELELDTFDGSAWVGIVPFVMCDVRLRGLPAIPGITSFPELNVRTYVTHRGKPGVWFFSLDASSRLAVRAARLTWRLPYYDARMTVAPDGDFVHYQSTRTHRHAPPARLAVRYRPTGPIFAAAAGSLEHFLTARMCLYSANRREQVFRGDIDHVPWPLQPAEAEIEINEMMAQIGLSLPDQPPLFHFSRSIDARAWRIKSVID